MGRPPKYDPSIHPALIEAMRVQGMTFDQMAVDLGIHPRTFYKWIDTYPEVKAALKASTGTLLEKIADSLCRMALGFSYEETKVYGHLDDAGHFVTDKIERVQKQSLPSVAAAMCVLTNKDPDHWKHRQEITGVLDDRRAVVYDLTGDGPEAGTPVPLPARNPTRKNDSPVHSDDGGDGRGEDVVVPPVAPESH